MTGAETAIPAGGTSPVRPSPPKTWVATKFERVGSCWRATRAHGPCSRLVGDLQAAAYQRALETYARGRLIDLGCGNAPLAGIYRDLVARFEWADWPNSLHQRFAPDHRIDLNQPLPLETAAYDTILLSDVLEHIARPNALFDELARILAPGGHLIVGVPFFYWIHEEPHDHFRYTRYQLERFGRDRGLEVMELREVGGGLDSWCDLTIKLLDSLWRPLGEAFYWSWRVIRRTPPVARINERAARRLPLAYLAVYRRPA